MEERFRRYREDYHFHLRAMEDRHSRKLDNLVLSFSNQLDYSLFEVAHQLSEIIPKRYEGDTTRRLNTEQKLLHHETQGSAKPLPNPDSAPISFQLTKIVFARKKRFPAIGSGEFCLRRY
ncbi:hypothetical protein ACSQ67_014657 [Phaseolus vulgaris]